MATQGSITFTVTDPTGNVDQVVADIRAAYADAYVQYVNDDAGNPDPDNAIGRRFSNEITDVLRAYKLKQARIAAEQAAGQAFDSAAANMSHTFTISTQ